MKSKVQKWGKSLAMLIPRFFAVETRLEADVEVSLTLVDDSLVIKQIDEPEIILEQLLLGITEDK